MGIRSTFRPIYHRRVSRHWFAGQVANSFASKFNAEKVIKMKLRAIDPLRNFTFCALGSVCCLMFISEVGRARADDLFNANGGTTGTEGVVGNPDCAPPTEIVNGRKITPLNWSCDSSGYWPRVAPHVAMPSGRGHPGPAYVPGAASPCLPFGPGGYNWLANPVGTALPPGCERSEQRKPLILRGSSGPTDSHRDILPYKLRITAPTPPDEGTPDIYRKPTIPLGGWVAGPDPDYRSPTLPLTGQIGTGE